MGVCVLVGAELVVQPVSPAIPVPINKVLPNRNESQAGVMAAGAALARFWRGVCFGTVFMRLFVELTPHLRDFYVKYPDLLVIIIYSRISILNRSGIMNVRAFRVISHFFDEAVR